MRPTEVDSMNRLRVEAERKVAELKDALRELLYARQASMFFGIGSPKRKAAQDRYNAAWQRADALVGYTYGSTAAGVIETVDATRQQGNEVECPLCKGSGDREFFDTTRGPHGESYTVNCDRCGGTGAIAAGVADAAKTGDGGM